MSTLIESCRISPSGDVAHNLSLPLTFFDIRWIIFHPIRNLFFYEYHECSKPYFSDTLVPALKQSLSFTLKHYLPLAANLIVPSHIDEKPFLRYVSGDSVLLTFAESTYGFDDLVGNHAQDADQFYHFVPVVALKVTLFPGRGICIGFAQDHCVGDESSMVRFINAWASITKLITHGDYHDHYSPDQSMPIFNRSVIKDPRGVGSLYWETVKTRGLISPLNFKSSSFPLPTNRVRATYTLHQADIENLKNLVFSAKRISGGRVSSYVVMAAYVWTCLVKSGVEVGEQVDDNVAELFVYAVDARARMDPPVPANYFGNCLSYGMATVHHKQLVSERGFVIAAEAIAEDIINGVNNKDQVLFRAENWVSDMEKFRGARKVVVSGSPKFDFSEADFGWGRTRKFETVSIDGENYSMSLCKSSSSDGGLEIGLSLPRERMEAFAAIFAQGLRLTPRVSL